MEARELSHRDSRARDDHIALYRKMLVIRHAEKACARLFAEGAIPGFIHLSIGQEAVSVGLMSVLRDDDTITSTHRGHGHALAKGLSLPSFFGELLERQIGACKGRGGSMHVAELSVGMLGANGIVGGGIAIALGSGLAHQLKGAEAIAVAFFGDGAMAEGALHESLNMASLLSVPVLFACEANGWSEFSPTRTQISFSLDKLAAAYELPFERIDGSDVRVVAATAARVIGQMRKTRKPMVVECVTDRIRGHYEGDSQRYRDDQDRLRDPLIVSRDALQADGVPITLLEALESEVEAEILAAIEPMKTARAASFESALADVYAPVRSNV